MKVPVVFLVAEDNPSIITMFWKTGDREVARPIGDSRVYKGYRSFISNKVQGKFERYGCEVITFESPIISCNEREVPEEVENFKALSEFSDKVMDEFMRSLRNDSLQDMERVFKV